MTNQKQFGVWMDLHNAVIVGREETEAGDFAVLGEIKAEEVYPNSNEKAEHNHQKTAEAKFFKEITSHLTNATYIHLTGTGDKMHTVSLHCMLFNNLHSEIMHCVYRVHSLWISDSQCLGSIHCHVV